MEKRERDRLEAALKKMVHDFDQVEEWERERKNKKKRSATGPKTGNVIRRRKGRRDKRLTTKVRKSG